MEKIPKSKINLRIDKLLSYPGCDEKTLSMRKTIWLSSFIGFVYMGLVAPIAQFMQPDAQSAIYYSYFMLILLFLAVVIIPHLKNYFVLFCMTISILEILATFIIIVLHGGISNEYSMLFACLGFMLLAIPLNNYRFIAALFCLFVVLTLIVVFIGSSMKVPSADLTNAKWKDLVSVMSIFFMSALALYFISTFMRKQQSLEQMEAIKQKDLNEAKTRLFTNITHEFRTPLTVIRGMADLIDRKPEVWIPEGTNRIRSNSNLILRLVNQMLDISKIEAKAMPVHMIKGDIARYSAFIIDLHRSAAIGKNISLKFSCLKKSIIMDFDPDMFSQILSNLLGNAIKFTPENGLVGIKISINEPEELFTLHVTDSGKGIPEDKIKYVFDRFYQVENHANSGGGTGLGLALAKELTMLMNGNITVDSLPGKGSVFTVALPVTRLADPGEHFLSSYYKKGVIHSQENKTSKIEAKHTTGADIPFLLIVEDSKDVSLYLSAILGNEYHIELARNGKAGLEKAIEKVPDIIISDVMMPEMDGIEMLGKLKTDFRTSHIPVVMLTAKADIDSRLAGLERGADAYITKPFNEAELHVQLRNLIELRKKLHERYSSVTGFPESHDPALKAEDAFVRKMHELLEKNIDNDEFNINDLCRELAVSHTQLYRKFKSISNLTTADYFKLMRLNKAKELLTASEMSITQIAFAVGFKNLSHFSREFALQFGKSPKEIRKSANPNLAQITPN
jgi:signal transduction histidine kinase/DNA-binding response OmpR family regulator